jgi:CDP-diacylglycerol--serine O-phosphatidyltransferase
MRKLSFPQTFMQPQALRGGRRSRAAYAVPSLFTAGNIFLGFIAILQCFEGVMAVVAGTLGANSHFELAAKMIGIAVVLDGLDGRIARMMNTTSDFGRELDSLADAITFGLAPAVLAYTWGVQFLDTGGDKVIHDNVLHAGYFVSFLYLLSGVCRLARFNVQTNPIPKNPGRPDRKYFVGLPIPAAAGMVASVVYAADAVPLRWWPFGVAWMALLALLSFLMVSTWRYRSFKDLNMMHPRSPVTIIFVGSLIYLLWYYAQPLLLTITSMYVASGIFIRLAGVLRRAFKHSESRVS